ncbi:hypothetical protein, partial [Vibrio sp.]|uniref:hypothetical protein n=1 Tax=Vibrio sp. TaxID=678 RepID=UPI003F6B9EE2
LREGVNVADQIVGFRFSSNELRNKAIASSSLFLKLLQLTYSRHDFKPDEKNYAQHMMTELVKNNRSVSQKAIKKLSSIYED